MKPYCRFPSDISCVLHVAFDLILCAAFCCRRLQIVNSLLHIVPLNLALSYKPDTLHMTSKVVDGSSGNQAFAEADKAHKTINYGGMRLGQGGEEVRAITLDSLNLKNVSLIKVDVQGAEQLMFYGARDTIRRNMPVIAYEIQEGELAAALTADLSLPEEVGWVEGADSGGTVPGGQQHLSGLCFCTLVCAIQQVHVHQRCRLGANSQLCGWNLC